MPIRLEFNFARPLLVRFEVNLLDPLPFIRLGDLEVALEKHGAPSDRGWLSAEGRWAEGELQVNIGKWAVYFVNHKYWRSREAGGAVGA